MDSGSTWLWEACGSPAVEECEPADGICWMCGGQVVRGQRHEDWQGASFVGQNRIKAPFATHVCEPCVYVCKRSSPVPGRPAKEGMQFGPNFRNYSHLMERRIDGSLDYVNASKGEKPVILAFLRRAHAGEWIAAVADSGQKHVVPWAPVNPPGIGGRALFDERTVTLPRTPEGWRMVDEMAVFLTTGATKEEIERGEYSPYTWQRIPDAIRTFEVAHGRARGSSWFVLALWLAQRDEAAVAERQAREKEEKRGRDADRRAQTGNGARRARRAARVPDDGGERAQGVGPDRGPDASGNATEHGPGGVGDAPVEVAPAGAAKQLGFAFDR